MKKIILSTALALSLIAASVPAHAAESHPIIMDGVAITSDVQPEMKNGRTMVPLRVISENLGAVVDWSGSEVTITRNDIKVTLQLNSSTAVKDGKTLQLDAKPYIHNNRTLVPLRFIAETFGCTVNYSKSTVTVDTAPLIINGVKVTTLQYEYHMVIGGYRQQLSGKRYNEEIYALFESNKGAKVDAPTNYGWNDNWNTLGWYTKTGQYDFLDTAGHSVQRFDPYTLSGPSGLNGFTEEQLAGYPKVLIFDAVEGQWYMFSETALDSIAKLMNTAEQNGLLKSTEL
ncbi:copper amine oxidase N-terminal domain-containing protein [Paenibacillus sediminis]|uniref:Copper amine oxidase-like N-terminal domain-containing protein n=1 Tax=Paenibacillus sediminis TaxID=664909 RepID=A0ABS4H0G1_9BACL|nr:copper amine oxidase N-terminal domain-containing protein [Paenibacillus sediminis]MBP1936032.1 hypothetical protein [Paenibacillus sediminis]